MSLSPKEVTKITTSVESPSQSSGPQVSSTSMQTSGSLTFSQAASRLSSGQSTASSPSSLSSSSASFSLLSPSLSSSSLSSSSLSSSLNSPPAYVPNSIAAAPHSDYILRDQVHDELYEACKAMLVFVSNKVEFIKNDAEIELDLTRGYASYKYPNGIMDSIPIHDLGKKPKPSIIKQMARDQFNGRTKDLILFFESVLIFLNKKSEYELDVIFYVFKDELAKRTRLAKRDGYVKNTGRDIIISFLNDQVLNLEKCLSKDFTDFTQKVPFKTIVDLEQLEEVRLKTRGADRKKLKEHSRYKDQIKKVIKNNRYTIFTCFSWHSEDTCVPLAQQLLKSLGKSHNTEFLTTELNSFSQEVLRFIDNSEKLKKETLSNHDRYRLSEKSSPTEILDTLLFYRIWYAKMNTHENNNKELIAWTEQIKKIFTVCHKKFEEIKELRGKIHGLFKDLYDPKTSDANPLLNELREKYTTTTSAFEDFIKECSEGETRKGTLSETGLIEKTNEFHNSFNAIHSMIKSYIKIQQEQAEATQQAAMQKIKEKEIQISLELKEYNEKTQLELTQYKKQVAEEAERRKQSKREKIIKNVEQEKIKLEYTKNKQKEMKKRQEEMTILLSSDTLSPYQALIEQIFEKETPHYVIRYEDIENLIEALGGKIKAPGHGGSHRTVKLFSKIAYFGALSDLQESEEDPGLQQEQTCGIVRSHKSEVGKLSRYDVRNIRSLLERSNITPKLFCQPPASKPSIVSS